VHELAAFGAQHVVLPGCRLGCNRLIGSFCWWFCGWQQVLLQDGQSGAQGRSEETVVAYVHEATRQDVLEKALDELLHGEGTKLELPGA
jgi:hypothetical protein